MLHEAEALNAMSARSSDLLVCAWPAEGGRYHEMCTLVLRLAFLQACMHARSEKACVHVCLSPCQPVSTLCRRKWSSLAETCLTLCKCLEHKLWLDAHPLRQFEHTLSYEVGAAVVGVGWRAAGQRGKQPAVSGAVRRAGGNPCVVACLTIQPHHSTNRYMGAHAHTHTPEHTKHTNAHARTHARTCSCCPSWRSAGWAWMTCTT